MENLIFLHKQRNVLSTTTPASSAYNGNFFDNFSLSQVY